MDPDHDLIRESERRSRIRVDSVLVVDARGPLTIAMIAELCGTNERTITWALDGRLPYYRPELSPVTLGLLAEIPRSSGRRFTITPKGERWAATWAEERREAARRILLRAEPIRGSARLDYRASPLG